ncbi:hypothetical protein [Pseudoclavibacter terrae]|nr:hypothetical protein [Pseudoclavibacter terrae]
MTTWLDGSEFAVSAVWARLGASPEWIAQRTDVLVQRLSESLRLTGWQVVGGGDWEGTEEQKVAVVAAHVNSGSGQAQLGDGYSFSLFASNAAVHVRLHTQAGSDRVGRRLPSHSSMLHVSPTGPGAVSGEQGEAMVEAMVEAWSPLQVDLSIPDLFKIARRGGWKIPPANRLWLAAEVGAADEAAEGVAVSRLGDGTLFSAPDDWDAQRVVDAMAETRERNGLDVLPH